jgi:hypothetical protein
MMRKDRPPQQNKVLRDPGGSGILPRVAQGAPGPIRGHGASCRSVAGIAVLVGRQRQSPLLFTGRETRIMPGKMKFLCCVNPIAGKDEAVLTKIRTVFGADAELSLLEETSDIYIACDPSESVCAKLRQIQADPDVIDTQIEVMVTRFSSAKETRSHHAFVVFADLGAGEVDTFIDALKADVNRVKAGQIEVLYIGEIFSARADVVVILATNYPLSHHLSKRLRALPGVVDTDIYYFRHTDSSC